jgi:hypothetical protein
MNLFERVKLDIKAITTNVNEFSTEVTFTAPNGDTATVNAQYSDHSNSYDSEGMPITGKFTHVTISEDVLTELNYPTRNSAGLINMLNHTMAINYADGSVRNYIVSETRPDYTINLILLILSDYAVNN